MVMGVLLLLDIAEHLHHFFGNHGLASMELGKFWLFLRASTLACLSFGSLGMADLLHDLRNFSCLGVTGMVGFHSFPFKLLFMFSFFYEFMWRSMVLSAALLAQMSLCTICGRPAHCLGPALCHARRVVP